MGGEANLHLVRKMRAGRRTPLENIMRDMEDAAAATAWIPPRKRTIALSLLAGMAVGCVSMLVIAPPRGARFEARLDWNAPPPSAHDWLRPAEEGENVRVEGRGGVGKGSELVVTSGSASSARALMRNFAARQAPTAEQLVAKLTPLRENWRQAAPKSALQFRARSTECAALLLARARWGEELALELPVAAPMGPAREFKVPREVEDAWLNVTWVAEERDLDSLRLALDAAGRADRQWFADTTQWAGWSVTERAQAWREWQHQCAQLLEPTASKLMEWAGGAQRLALESSAKAALVQLDAEAGDPWAPFAVANAAPVRPLVRPVLSAWLPTLLMGMGTGSLTALFLLVVVALSQPGFPRSRVLLDAFSRADPGAIAPALHVVTGASPVLVARAALELASHRVAHGDRVLIVDGSPKLRLHERLGRDARWGLLECLAAEMPVLGLVQYGGHPGLYLLPHGNAGRSVGWSLLGRKLDELLPNFGRIILAVDPSAPTSLGDALRGRAMEGWWAGAERRHARGAEDAMGRLGIALNPLSLSDMPEASLEAMGTRVLVLRPAGPLPELAPITAPVPVPPPAPRRAVLEPIVLDCDLQVRQRLRFLAWMRRVQAEDQHEVARVSS